jgi:hypothetical protein
VDYGAGPTFRTHQSPSDVRQCPRITKKSAARLRLPNGARNSLIGTAYSRTDGRSDGQHSQTFRIKILGRDNSADLANRRICCLQSLDFICFIGHLREDMCLVSLVNS